MHPKRLFDLKTLTEGWGIELSDLIRLNQALTHPTYVFEHKNMGLSHNQRLEFLGDAVLGLAVGDYLYHRYPNLPEGDLTKMRAAVVCETSLAKRAKALHIGNYLLLGRGEEISGGRERPSILADAFEAVVGAIYLEKGFLPAQSFILKELEAEISAIDLKDYGDYKTMLQELVQKHGVESVSYVILKETGPDHNKRFLAGVTYKERLLARGSGRSKKEAEQKAAQTALKSFDEWKQYLSGGHHG